MLGILMGIGPPWKFGSCTTIILKGPTSFFDWFYNFLVITMRTLLKVRSWIAQPTSGTLMTICPLESNQRFDQVWLRKMSGARWKNGPMTLKLWPWPILIILHNICVAIQDLTKNVKNWSEKWVGLDEKMVLRLWNFGHSLSSSYYTIYVLQSKIWPNLTKKVKKIWEKWVGLDEKMVLWLRNFGHGLSSSCYTIYVLQ